MGEVREGAAECCRASNALKFNMKTLSMQMNVATCLCLWTVAASASAASPKNGIGCSRAEPRYDTIRYDPKRSHLLPFDSFQRAIYQLLHGYC